MRHTYCPRCDNLLDKNGHCSSCGYQVKVRCHHCGHLNIPIAKYCGYCGKGTSLAVRYRTIINSLLNPFQQIKLKRFFAGIAFGSLLAIFAFSSLGMKYNTDNAAFPIQNTNEVSSNKIDENIINSTIIKSFSSDLDEYICDKNLSNKASIEDIKSIINIMTKNLNYIAYRINTKKYPLKDAESYFEQERSINNNKNNATRGNVALLLFAYLSDLFELKYKDFTQGSSYSDIPKFNILDAPATALKKYNLKIALSEDKFGVNDEITLKELCEAAKQVAILIAERANKEAPDLVFAPNIIIE